MTRFARLAAWVLVIGPLTAYALWVLALAGGQLVALGLGAVIGP